MVKAKRLLVYRVYEVPSPKIVLILSFVEHDLAYSTLQLNPVQGRDIIYYVPTKIYPPSQRNLLYIKAKERK